MQEQTGTPVYIVILEEPTGTVLCASLDTLWRWHWKGPWPAGGWAFNFPRAVLKELATGA